jgi:hypothetical protein
VRELFGSRPLRCEREGVGEIRPWERVDLFVPLVEVVDVPRDEALARPMSAPTHDHDRQRWLLLLQTPVLDGAQHEPDRAWMDVELGR